MLLPIRPVRKRVKKIADDPAQSAPDDAQDEDLREEGCDDFVTLCPEAPEDPGIAAPAYHREHRRVVDQEDAHKEGQEREGLKVEAEGVEHGGEGLDSSGGPTG